MRGLDEMVDELVEAVNRNRSDAAAFHDLLLQLRGLIRILDAREAEFLRLSREADSRYRRAHFEGASEENGAIAGALEAILKGEPHGLRNS